MKKTITSLSILPARLRMKNGDIKGTTLFRDIPYSDIDAPHYINECGYVEEDKVWEFEALLVDAGYFD